MTASMSFESVAEFTLLVGLVLIASLFLFGGEIWIRRLPAMRRLLAVDQNWRDLMLSSARIPDPITLDEVIQRRFGELAAPNNRMNVLSAVQNIRFSDLGAVLRFRTRDLRHITRELQIYAAGFLMLFVLELFWRADEMHGKSMDEIAELVVSVHVVPVAEIIMLVYFGLRLVQAIQYANTLLEGE